MNNVGTIFKVRIEIVIDDEYGSTAICERQFTHPGGRDASFGGSAGEVVSAAFLGVADHMWDPAKQREAFVQGCSDHHDETS